MINKQTLDIGRIKLVIWDLDNTFWKGTLTEGGCEKILLHINLVQELNLHGIVSSICSKNTFDDCRTVLEQWGLWDQFVFPSIDWTPKGRRVQQLIADMNLRPANVLFLDDEPSNLQAALALMPDLMCGTADELCDELFKQCQSVKPDPSCSRLKRYQELQEKVTARKDFDSDEEFLRLSDIRVTIDNDCIPKLERVAELINRTNQLNFTKLRMDTDAVKELLCDSRYDCGCISCRDKFSDYGIVGFYALEKSTHTLLHYLFSCRTIGMGVEQYVYAKLNFPALTPVGDVVTHLDGSSCPDWISEQSSSCTSEKQHKGKKPSIIVKGPCDVSQVLPFFSGGAEFYTEFAYVSETKPGTYIESFNHTSQIVEALHRNHQAEDTLVQTLPFVDDAFFSTQLFQRNFDYFIFSALTDYALGLYRSKQDPNLVIPFGQYTVDYTQEENWELVKSIFGDDPDGSKKAAYHNFCENYEPIGRISDEDFLRNLTTIRENLPDSTVMIFLNGAERPYPGTAQGRWIGRDDLHRHMNEVLRQFTHAHAENCTIIDVNQYLSGEENPYLDTINHYKKNVYYHLAIGIQEYISGRDSSIHLKTRKRTGPSPLQQVRHFGIRIKHKIKSFLK